MNGDVSLEQLYAWADELALKHWGVKYTGTIDLTNRRWTRKNGHFMTPLASEKEVGIGPNIGFSRYRNARRTPDEVKRTLLHELVHWRLWSQGKPYSDVNEEFVAEAVRVGASISTESGAQWAYERYMRKVRTG